MDSKSPKNDLLAFNIGLPNRRNNLSTLKYQIQENVGKNPLKNIAVQVLKPIQIIERKTKTYGTSPANEFTTPE